MNRSVRVTNLEKETEGNIYIYIIVEQITWRSEFLNYARFRKMVMALRDLTRLTEECR